MQTQQASIVGTGSSNSHTDSQPSYSTDSASAAAHCIPGQHQQSAKQLVTKAATSSAQADNLVLNNTAIRRVAADSVPGPDPADATDKSVHLAQGEISGKVTAQQTASSHLQGTPSAGSSPPPEMHNRKRRAREMSPQDTDIPSAAAPAIVSVSAEVSSQDKGLSKAGALPSSPRLRSAKKQASEQVPSQASDPQQGPFESLALIQQVAFPELMQLAEENSIVWCRVKGFPAWPVSSSCPFHTDSICKSPVVCKTYNVQSMHSACLVLARWLSWSYTFVYTGLDMVCILFQAQILSATAAKPRLGHVPKVGKLPVIFFGTIEVTWSSSKDVCSWAQGLKNDLWSKNKSKNRQLFDLGVEQVLIHGVSCWVKCCCYLSMVCKIVGFHVGPCSSLWAPPVCTMRSSQSYACCSQLPSALVA